MHRAAIGALIIAFAASGCERKDSASTPPNAGGNDGAAAAAPAACPDGAGIENLACAGDTLCAAAAGDRVGLVELACAARAAAAGGPAEVSAIVSKLPPHFRHNITLKHGTILAPLRGHRTEPKSPGASASRPRVLMWDEKTGLSISFNGGQPNATLEDRAAGHRVGILRFDADASRFELWGLTVPARAPVQPDRPNACLGCHGPDSRPIWRMYPDWPQFVGSDNDEVTKDLPHQVAERTILRNFRQCTIADPPPEECAGRGLDTSGDISPSARYGAIFARDSYDRGLRERREKIDAAAIWTYLEKRRAGDTRRSAAHRLSAEAAALTSERDPAALAAWLKVGAHPDYPYRPDHAEAIFEPSRAFAHRPNSRLGLLYNRLHARAIMARIRDSAAYRALPRTVVFELMACAWGDDALRLRAYERLASASPLKAAPRGRRLHRRELLAALGLKVRDVDIRLAYNNPRLDAFDTAGEEPIMATNVMDVGHIRYQPGDPNNTHGAELYFNSYFDGSASHDELIVAMMLADLHKRDPSLAGLYKLNSLAAKYGHIASRWELDKELLTMMDQLGMWFPLPYPRQLQPVHHRQSFLRKSGGAPVFRDQHRRLCSKLHGSLSRDFETP